MIVSLALQVVQFLLARNYYLTALELLIESEHAIDAHKFEELRHFFSNPDQFPANELAKYQNANGKLIMYNIYPPLGCSICCDVPNRRTGPDNRRCSERSLPWLLCMLLCVLTVRAAAVTAAALDVQVLAREREEQLQVAQYERRVAQEDMQAARDQLTASKQELQVRCVACTNSHHKIPVHHGPCILFSSRWNA
jgi:hypothetical protein